MTNQTAVPLVSGLEWKNQHVDLIRKAQTAPRVSVSLSKLEEMRTHANSVPASKNSLELICGASCETAAQ